MISGIITTLNEESNIGEAIKSLAQVCDQIVVVDSLSSDRTVEEARAAGALVISQKYLGDGIQKNVALAHVTNKWVLSIDADERLSDELVEFIRRTDFENTPYDGFAVRRRNYVGSRWIRCCGWYPDYLVRLYRHDKLQFRPVKQHSTVPTDNTLRIKADLIHYRYNSTADLFAKPQRNYASRGAKLIYLSHKRVHAWSPILHGSFALFANLFLRGGILGGVDGISVSLAVAQNSYLKYAKVLEWQRDPKVRDAENFDDIW